MVMCKKKFQSKSLAYVYLEDILIFAVVTESVFAPTGRPAPGTRKVSLGFGQAGRRDVRSVVGRWPVKTEDSQVVVESAGVKVRMDSQLRDVTLFVGEELYVVVDIPFAKTHSKIESRVSEGVGKVRNQSVISYIASSV